MPQSLVLTKQKLQITVIAWLIKLSETKGFFCFSLNKRSPEESWVFFAYVSGERSANRPKQLQNDAFHVKTSQSAKNQLDPAKNENRWKFDIRPFCTKAFNYAYTSLNFTRVSGWTLNRIWSLLRPCLQASRFPLKRVKGTRLSKRNVSGRVTLLPGIELRLVSLNKCRQNREAFSRKIHAAHMFPQCSQFPIREALFPVSVFVFKMQIMLALHSREL